MFWMFFRGSAFWMSEYLKYVWPLPTAVCGRIKSCHTQHSGYFHIKLYCIHSKIVYIMKKNKRIPKNWFWLFTQNKNSIGDWTFAHARYTLNHHACDIIRSVWASWENIFNKDYAITNKYAFSWEWQKWRLASRRFARAQLHQIELTRWKGQADM